MTTLAKFIRSNKEKIVTEWEQFARTLVVGEEIGVEILRDHTSEVLEAIIRDINLPQTKGEQTKKAQGTGKAHRMSHVAGLHARLRIEVGFNIGQVMAEYRALRASVLRLWSVSGGTDLEGITRFNECIDEVLAESVHKFSEITDIYRDRFLAILGHDLRNPLGAIVMGSKVLLSRQQNDTDLLITSRICSSAERMTRMISDLLDLTRARFGAGIPIAPKPMDLDQNCTQVIAELRTFHPTREIRYTSQGPMYGVWDSDRLAQVVSNIISNALQYSEGVVDVVCYRKDEQVTLDVHNTGAVILPGARAILFEPLMRGESQPGDSNMGLGLYISHQIVTSHNGSIEVISNPKDGTIFRVTLPLAVEQVA